MGDTWDWWWGGGDYYDRKQARQIEELGFAQAAQTRALQTKLRAQASDFGGRLDNLERAIAALLVLEDTREGLTEYAEYAAVRRYARDVIAQLPTLGGDGSAAPPITAPADVGDYWLHPAVTALAAVVHPGTADPAASFDEARRRDQRRADLFAVCVAALAGSHDIAGDFLSAPLPAGEITAEDRAVWVAAADGDFGEYGWRRTVDRLRQRRDVGALSAEAQESLVVGAFSHRTSTDPVDAGTKLAQMRGAMADAIGWTPDADTTSGSDHPLAEVFAVLVNEGADREQRILDAMAQSRNALAAVGIARAAERIPLGRPAGEPDALLRADLAGGNGPALQRLAGAVLAEPINAYAAKLKAIVDQPTTATEKVRINGQTIDVRADGAPPRSVATAAAMAPAGLQSRIPNSAVIAVAVVVALIGLVAGVAASPGWFVLAALAAVGGAVAFVADRRSTQVRTVQHGHSTTAAAATYTTAQDKLKQRTAAIDAAREQSTDDVTELAALLRRAAVMPTVRGTATASGEAATVDVAADDVTALTDAEADSTALDADRAAATDPGAVDPVGTDADPLSPGSDEQPVTAR